MAYLKFLDDSAVYRVTVVPSNNIVTLKFKNEKKVSTSGFDLFLDEKCEVDIGGVAYHSFNTVYRDDESTEHYNGYQLSSDGSVYCEPEQSREEYVPTLEDVKEMKITEMNAMQQRLIKTGIDVTLTDGSVEHFTLTDHDQTSLMGLQSQVATGTEQIPWHTSDEAEHCKFYSNADMALITSAAMAWVTWHVTYFRDLRIYIRSLQTEEEVEAIPYGIYIPEEYQSEPLKAMIAAQQS